MVPGAARGREARLEDPGTAPEWRFAQGHAVSLGSRAPPGLPQSGRLSLTLPAEEGLVRSDQAGEGLAVCLARNADDGRDQSLRLFLPPSRHHETAREPERL